MADENEVALKIIFNDFSGNRLEVQRIDFFVIEVFHWVIRFTEWTSTMFLTLSSGTLGVLWGWETLRYHFECLLKYSLKVFDLRGEF